MLSMRSQVGVRLPLELDLAAEPRAASMMELPPLAPLPA